MSVALCLILLFVDLPLIGSLECFVCHHSQRSRDVAEHLNQHPQCLSAEMFELIPGMRRNCTELEPYCSSTVTNINGFFLEIERDCSEVCKPMCSSNGYGLSYSQCTRCCNASLCNFFDGRNYLQDENAGTKATASFSLIVSMFHVLLYESSRS
ncbi:Toxin-TOLIP domain-containing protein [Aphelenchoides fujianensis]|nr:Toxin-TOLIP domain-containing protein [Aphelenchoides fujianensis]